MNNFSEKIKELVENNNSFEYQHMPHMYIRHLVVSKGVSFYLYWPTGWTKCTSKVQDLNGNTLGYISPELYHELVDLGKNKRVKESLNLLMKA